MDTSIVLLVSEKLDAESDEVVEAWRKKGGEVKHLGKYWIKEDNLAVKKIAIYGNQTFALILAQLYGKDLLSPDDALIARLDQKWTKRNIKLLQIRDLTENAFPLFVKPLVPKLFPASLFNTKNNFDHVVDQLQGTENILASEIVDDIEAEARGYVMDGLCKDFAFYEGFADINTGVNFLNEFLTDHKYQLPKVVVIDVAYSQRIGWFILEFNACWGSGLNNCHAEKVIECIINATVNK